MVSMDTSTSSARLSGISCTQSGTSRSSVPELADGNSIQVLSSSASAEQLSDHNEDKAQPKVVSLMDRLRSGKKTKSPVKPS